VIETLVRLSGVLVAVAATAWAGLVALAEEAAVGDALHTLGDAPLATGTRVPLHRALHIARLALLVLAAVGAAHALQWWTRPWPAAFVVVTAAGLLLFVVGDALPRSLARVAPDLAGAALPLARRTLPPFGLLLMLLTWLDQGFHALVPTPRLLPPELGIAQRDMLLGVFTLADTTVEEVMTPRLDLVGVDLAAPLHEVFDRFRSSSHTRLPVFDGTPDSVMGVIFAKDLVPLKLGVGDAVARWQDLIRPAQFVPEAKTLDRQLRDFQRGPAHVAIVVDEFGGTSGLITLEDILEEVVGEIHDEHEAIEPPPIERDGARCWVDGRVSLDELSAALGVPLAHPDVTTVGGLIYSLLGHVPRAGEELTLDGYRVVVEQVVRRRVRRVYFEPQS